MSTRTPRTPRDPTARAKPAETTSERAHAAICRLLDREDVLVLDTETTGLGNSEVIELSVIDTLGNVRLDTLIRPRRPVISPGAARVHGITLPMLQDQPTWPEVLPELERIARHATVLAWNASFDRRMLQQTSRIWDLEHPTLLFGCAMTMYARYRGRTRAALHKSVVAEGLEHLLEEHTSHRALGDVTFTLEILRACARS